jgi:hypothetical protein
VETERDFHVSQSPLFTRTLSPKTSKESRRHLISCEKQGHTTPLGTCKLYFLHTTDVTSKKTRSPWTSSWLSIIFIMNKDSKSSKNADLFRCEEHIHYNLDWSIPESACGGCLRCEEWSERARLALGFFSRGSKGGSKGPRERESDRARLALC